MSFAKPNEVAPVQHYSALPVADLQEFWIMLKAEQSLGAKALQLIILTAARSGEARGATWDEINFKAKLWTIAAARMTGGREHKVPQPGSEAAPNLFRTARCHIMKQSLWDDAGVDKDTIRPGLAFDGLSIVL